MEEWKIIKACDYCYNVTDGTHDSPKQKEVGKHLITSKHIKENRIDFEHAYKISEEDYKKIISRSKVDQWDILISMIGAYCGFCCIESSTQTDYAIKNVGLFKIGDELKCRWLYYYLTSPQGKEQLSILRSGSSQPYIPLGALRNLDIPVPSTQYMELTISILKSLDDKIELNRRINENLEQQAQALFKSWFVDFEPFKNGKFVDSELGMIPEGWRVGVLADIANITMGQSPKGTSYNEIGDGISFYQGRAEFGNRFPSVRLFTTEPSRYAEPYSVLLSVRAPVGDINIAVERCCIGRGLASILSKNKHQSFVLYTMFFLKKELDKFNSEGTVFGSINRSSLENLKIIIPPVDIIDKFENLTSKIDVMLLNLFQETTSLAQLRDTLLPRLMSGELEIKDNSYD